MICVPKYLLCNRKNMAHDDDIDWDNYEWDEELGEMVAPKKNDDDDDQDEGDSVPDADGKPLISGDSVKTIKDLDVKGMPKVIKRGETVKKIKIVNGGVECKFGSKTVILKASFLKKC